MMVLLLVGLAVGAAVLVAAALFDGGDGGEAKLVKRARALAEADAGAGPGDRVLRRTSRGRFDDLLVRLLPRPGAIQTRLEATGYPITLTHYGLASAAVLLVMGVLGIVLHAPPLLALLEAAGSAIWLPHAVVGYLMARRRGRFFKAFPEAIGLMVRGLRAGLPVSQTLSTAGREIDGPVGEEFRRVADQVRLGVSLEDALWQSAKRIELPEFNFLVISLSVQRETGGNLAETLENLEQILRRRKQMRLKIRAMASEATWSALIIGCLPFVMGALMFVVSAEYIRHLLTDPLGRLMLAGAGVSLTVGAFVMRKMTRFEI